MTRRLTVDAPPERVFELVSDPHSQPRWWPRVKRVEDVRGDGRRARWTQVLEAASGRAVRADFHCVSSSRPERYIFEQDLEGTPFAKHLKLARIEIAVSPAADGGSRVSATAEERPRGLSRLGGLMMRGAAKRRLDEALTGIDSAVGESAAAGG